MAKTSILPEEDEGTEKSKSNISIVDNNGGCLQEVHGKDEFLQAIQVLAQRFKVFWFLLLITRVREDWLSAFTGTWLKKLLFHM